MAMERSLTKEDLLLKMRLLAEGVRYDVKGPLLWHSTDPFVNVTIVFDHCEIVAETRANPRSRLVVALDGMNATVVEGDEVLATATLQPRAEWRGKKLSDGTSLDDATIGQNSVSYIATFNRCSAYDTGKPCKFCAAGEFYSQSGPWLTLEQTVARAEGTIEATMVAIQSGLRFVLLIGGAAPPNRRDQWTTDLLEAIMSRFREGLGDELLSRVRFMPSLYPPEDLGEIGKWKAFGINAVEFDSQVMDPAYFKAICPGRGDQRHWFEAQEEAVAVYGRDGGCTSNVILGLEPMDGMLKGVEERLSKGVTIQPLVFKPWQESELEAMQPPSAEWFLEAFEGIRDIELRHLGHSSIPTADAG